MSSKFLFKLIFVFSILVSSGVYFVVNAQDLSGVVYPIPELGNCASQQDCKYFCDQPENEIICAEWAVKNGLMSYEDLEMLKAQKENLQELQEGTIPEGPGGCKTPQECEAYCQDPTHGEECFKFGVEHGLISDEKAQEIREKVQAYRGPGGCKTIDGCERYCSQPEHMEECALYAVQEGVLTPDEISEIKSIMQREKERKNQNPPEGFHPKPKSVVDEKKAAEVLKQKAGPGGCQTVEECRQYCSDISHASECLEFVEKNNLADSNSLEEMKTLIEEGGPGGCQSPKECDEYCSDPSHQIECLEFAKKHNLVSPEEASVMEKMAGGGPGGCRTQAECDAYCQSPEHMQECLMFSVKSGMMTPEEAQRIMELMQKQKAEGFEKKGTPSEDAGPYKGIMPKMFENGMPKQNEWHGRGAEDNGYFPPQSDHHPKEFNLPPEKERQEWNGNFEPPKGSFERRSPEMFPKAPERDYQNFHQNEMTPPHEMTPPREIPFQMMPPRENEHGREEGRHFGPPPMGEFSPEEPIPHFGPRGDFEEPFDYPDGHPPFPQEEPPSNPPIPSFEEMPEENNQSFFKRVNDFVASIGSLVPLRLPFSR